MGCIFAKLVHVCAIVDEGGLNGEWGEDRKGVWSDHHHHQQFDACGGVNDNCCAFHHVTMCGYKNVCSVGCRSPECEHWVKF